MQNSLLSAMPSEGESITLTVGEITIQGKVGTKENPACSGPLSSVEWPEEEKERLPDGDNINCLTSQYVV